jgi:hypothetical protein
MYVEYFLIDDKAEARRGVTAQLKVDELHSFFFR